MASEQVNPYLMFDGKAAEAIAFYEKAFGVKADQVTKHGDVPGQPVPAERRGRVMHAAMRVGAGTLMFSDGDAGEVQAGNNVRVSLHFGDKGRQKRVFDALADGGTVTLPLMDAPWGATFGMLVDRFGVHWLLNCDTRKA